MKPSRREFLRTSGIAMLALSGVRAAAASDVYRGIFPQTILGANERIHTGHIGIGAMGRMNLGIAIDLDDVLPVAVCDLWPPHREFARNAVAEACNPRVTSHTYHEELVTNKDIDAVVISTPDHWHALPAIMALDAGKAVYCEKPLATTVSEGRAMVEAVRRNRAVFQAGTMQRSGAHFKAAVDLVHRGLLGRIGHVETNFVIGLPPTGIGRPPDEPVPDGLDWERYVGWTPKVPYNENRFLTHFRWFLEYSGGYMTDWGVHLIDIALWAMGEDKKPRSVATTGGRYVLDDNRNTPDTLDVLYDFGDYSLRFSNRAFNGRQSSGRKADHAIVFYGTSGTLIVDRDGYEVIPAAEGACAPVKSDGSPMNVPHWLNFIECIRSGDRPVCDAEVCHNTTTVCHMGTAAWVAGARLDWNAANERFEGGDAAAVEKANAFIHRPYAHGWSLTAPHYKEWA